MKFLFVCGAILLQYYCIAQTSEQVLKLTAHLDPNNNVADHSDIGRAYTGCWGWYQAEKQKEYAIVGGSNGTYFIDVSDPYHPLVSAFVSGKPHCNWREIKTYKNYCYIASDDVSPNTFQIVDMSALPSTVSLVYNGTELFEKGHTLWIDQDHLYVGSVSYSVQGMYSSMNVYSLEDPASPRFLRSLNSDCTFLNAVHDMHVRNDTVFASCGQKGLFVFKFDRSTNTFKQIGSYSDYTGPVANHSGYLTQNGKFLVFTDEAETSPIKIVNIENLQNFQPASEFIPHPKTTPHNAYVIGNEWVVVSCYQDGLFVYNISDPYYPILSGWYDTYTEGGFNSKEYTHDKYMGNWGAYPFLPSGIIIAVDIKNGLFLLNADPLFKKNSPPNQVLSDIAIYPNPSQDKIIVTCPKLQDFTLTITNAEGIKIAEYICKKKDHEEIDIRFLNPGVYSVQLKSNGSAKSEKVIINR